MTLVWQGYSVTVQPPSRIQFGSGEHDWVMVDPTDGEEIERVELAGSDLVVTKPSRKFIFFNVTPPKDGLSAIFNYRVVTERARIDNLEARIEALERAAS